LKIEVRNNNVEKALRVMKKKMKRDGVFQELKDRQYYQKPSEVKREKAKQRLVNIKKAQKLKRNFL
jgi:small subunit ribosomal protein S21|tara:strand:+ start:887 stop:1084 length:198 start_codon:yes stop_codon:yes gene_type:complete